MFACQADQENSVRGLLLKVMTRVHIRVGKYVKWAVESMMLLIVGCLFKSLSVFGLMTSNGRGGAP